jgi:cysteinyl-tRNA synthetase
MHIGHVNVDGAKMSKSLNNFILVKDIITNENANGLR